MVGRMTSGDTAYGKLSEEQKLYIWYIYDLLRSENIFSLANVDTSDSVYYDWIYGDSTSLSQLLTYGISKNWINMSLHLRNIRVFRSHMMRLLIMLYQRLIQILHF